MLIQMLLTPILYIKNSLNLVKFDLITIHFASYSIIAISSKKRLTDDDHTFMKT